MVEDGRWSNELCGWKDLRLNKEGDFWQCKIIAVPPVLTTPKLLILKRQYSLIDLLNMVRPLFQTLYLTTGLRMGYLSKFRSHAVTRGDPSPVPCESIDGHGQRLPFSVHKHQPYKMVSLSVHRQNSAALNKGLWSEWLNLDWSWHFLKVFRQALIQGLSSAIAQPWK